LSETEAWSHLRALLSIPSTFAWFRVCALLQSQPGSFQQNALPYCLQHLQHWPRTIWRSSPFHLSSGEWDNISSVEHPDRPLWPLLQEVVFVLDESLSPEAMPPEEWEPEHSGIHLYATSSMTVLKTFLHRPEWSPSLRKLTLRDFHLYPEHWETLAKASTPNLHTLRLEDSWLTPSDARWNEWWHEEDFPSLRSLRLIEGVFPRSPDIDSLDGFLANTPLLTQLEHLQIQGCCVPERASELFVRREWPFLHSMEWVHTVSPPLFVEPMGKSPESFPALDSLALEEIGLTPYYLNQLVQSPLRLQLKRLNLSENPLGEEEAMEVLCSNVVWPELEELHLSYTSNSFRPDPDWFELAQSEAFPALKRLNLSGSRQVPTALRQLVQAPWARGLEVLDLRHTAIEDRDLVPLIQPGLLPSLKALLLDGTYLTVDGFRGLVESPLASQLWGLCLTLHPEVTNPHAPAFLNSVARSSALSSLRTLVLEAAPTAPRRLSDFFLDAELPSLRVLQLKEAPLLSHKQTSAVLNSALGHQLHLFSADFPPQYREEMRRYFSGVAGGILEAWEWGSFLNWSYTGLPRPEHRHWNPTDSLWMDGDDRS
jgi:hypothetical protein